MSEHKRDDNEDEEELDEETKYDKDCENHQKKIETRRKIRKEYREIDEEYVTKSAQLADLQNEQLQKLHKKQDKIFLTVTHTREQLLDAQALNKAADILRTAAINADDASKRYDFASYAVAVKERFTVTGTNHFNWKGFGQDIGGLMLAAPSMAVMLGPLSKPAKVAKQRAERAKPQGLRVEARCEEIVQKEGEEDQADEATTNRVKTLKEFCRVKTYPSCATSSSSSSSSSKAKAKKSSAQGQDDDLPNEPGTKFDLLTSLVDCADPVQTVENFFDFAFLIKEKYAAETFNAVSHRPEAVYTTPQMMAEHGEERQQHVLTMGMKDIKRISQLLSAQAAAAQQGSRRPDPCPLHRTDELYQAKDAHEQAEIIAGRADGKTKQGRKRILQASQSQGHASASAESQASPAHGSSSSSSSSAKRGKRSS